MCNELMSKKQIRIRERQSSVSDEEASFVGSSIGATRRYRSVFGSYYRSPNPSFVHDLIIKSITRRLRAKMLSVFHPPPETIVIIIIEMVTVGATYDICAVGFIFSEREQTDRKAAFRDFIFPLAGNNRTSSWPHRERGDARVFNSPCMTVHPIIDNQFDTDSSAAAFSDSIVRPNSPRGTINIIKTIPKFRTNN